MTGNKAGREAFHMQAYVDYVRFAAATPELIDQFQREKNVKYVPPRNGLEEAIDKASGRTERLLVAFLEWCAEKYGVDYLPKDYLELVHPKSKKGKPR